MIHYMTGKEQDIKTSTKTGCGIRAEDIKRDSFVFWKNVDRVNCFKCQEKIAKILLLQGKGNYD
jgi:hypothetical protein